MTTVAHLHPQFPTWECPDLSLLQQTGVPAPEFPRAILGWFWSEWCEETAKAACAPFDYVAAGLLTVAGACLGNARIVQAGAWVEPPLLWTVLIGNPSSNKSPALDSLNRMVRDLQRDNPDSEFLLNDVTPRAAAEAAEASTKGNLLLRDELAGWWKTFGPSAGEQFWLQAFGARPHTLRRANSQRIQIPRLAISVLGGSQPGVIRGLFDKSQNSGFISRLLFVMPEAEPTFRFAETVNDALAFDALSRLWNLPGCPNPPACDVAPEALGELQSWVNLILGRTSGSDVGPHEQWLGKQRGIALRLALISEHLIWAAESPLAAAPPLQVSVSACRAARTFIDEYAEPMAERALAISAIPPELRNATRLLHVLQKNSIDRFNAARVRRGEFGPVGDLRNPPEMSAACEALEAACLIRNVGTRAGGTTGRKPQDYAVNPAVLRP